MNVQTVWLVDDNVAIVGKPMASLNADRDRVVMTIEGNWLTIRGPDGKTRAIHGGRIKWVELVPSKTK